MKISSQGWCFWSSPTPATHILKRVTLSAVWRSLNAHILNLPLYFAWYKKSIMLLDQESRQNPLIFRLRITTYLSQCFLPKSGKFTITHEHVNSSYGLKRWGHQWLCRGALLECSLTSNCLEALGTLSHVHLYTECFTEVFTLSRSFSIIYIQFYVGIGGQHLLLLHLSRSDTLNRVHWQWMTWIYCLIFLEPAPLTDSSPPKMLHEIKQDCKAKLAPDPKLLAASHFLTFSLVLVC